MKNEEKLIIKLNTEQLLKHELRSFFGELGSSRSNSSIGINFDTTIPGGY
jgi:hypothetical protein